MLRSVVTAVLALAVGANAHFTLDYPQPVGALIEDDEGTNPCGGHSVDLGSINTIDFHVGGDAIAATSTHPTTNWLFRITTDATASGNWSQIYGIVQQTGAGQFCAKDVTIPPQFVGQKAILGVVANGPDGTLFECSAIHLVNGTADAPSACVNGTKVTASYTDDKDLSSLVGSGSGNGGNSASPSPTTTPNAAPSLHTATTGGFGVLLTTGAMVLAGFALMVLI
ncbi:hypothetical protein GGS21DRAFT_199768 [Xylaria nigripes]|nr:hypothetical protein GGS21DRAFT_415573 [Xylaria nigripes]KAI2642952.1 hypothetical protein GGS21DRAFT_199768 [Xylaria nigripes]